MWSGQRGCHHRCRLSARHHPVRVEGEAHQAPRRRRTPLQVSATQSLTGVTVTPSHFVKRAGSKLDLQT